MRKFLCVLCLLFAFSLTSCSNTVKATSPEASSIDIIQISSNEEWTTYKNNLIEFSAPKELNFNQNDFGWWSLNYKGQNIAYIREEYYQHDNIPELFFRNMCDVLETEVLDKYFCPVLKKKYKCYFNVDNKPVVQYELIHAFLYNQKDRKAIVVNFNLKYVDENTIQKILDSVKLVNE